MADIVITPSAVVPGANANVLHVHNAGVEITAGKVVYLDDSNLWQLLDADLAIGTETTRTIGIALNHAYANQPLAVDVLDDDLTVGGTLAVGNSYFGSTNPGGLCPFADLAAGDYPVNLGIAKSTTKLNLRAVAAGAVI